MNIYWLAFKTYFVSLIFQKESQGVVRFITSGQEAIKSIEGFDEEKQQM